MLCIIHICFGDGKNFDFDVLCIAIVACSLFLRVGGGGLVVKVSLAGHSCADIIVAARPGQPRPDSAVCGGDSTSGEAAPGG